MVVQYLSRDADLDSNEHHHHYSPPHMASQSLPCLLPCSSPVSSLLATGTLFFICIILCRVSALRTCPLPSLRLLYVFLACSSFSARVDLRCGGTGVHWSFHTQVVWVVIAPDYHRSGCLYTHGYMLLQVFHNCFLSICSLSFLSGFFHRSEVDQFGEVTHLIFLLTHINSYLLFLALAIQHIFQSS